MPSIVLASGEPNMLWILILAVLITVVLTIIEERNTDRDYYSRRDSDGVQPTKRKKVMDRKGK